MKTLPVELSIEAPDRKPPLLENSDEHALQFHQA